VGGEKFRRYGAIEMKLTKSQTQNWWVASNRDSLESLRYAADICGYTPLTTATVAALKIPSTTAIPPSARPAAANFTGKH
jgi:hypothetical protein